MNDHIVRSVYFFSEEQWVPPAKHWPKYWFDKNSYSRWAVSEILELLSNRGDIKPSKIVKDFGIMICKGRFYVFYDLRHFWDFHD